LRNISEREYLVGNVGEMVEIFPFGKIFIFYKKFTSFQAFFAFMYYNMRMNKNMLKKQYLFIILSLGISLCFLFNASAMCLKCCTTVNSDGKGSLTAGFFSAVNYANDIVSSMMKSGDAAGNKINHNKINCCDVLDIVFIPVQTLKNTYKLIKNEFNKNELNFKSNAVVNDVDYPIKIPFWEFIFFILLFRMIFNVLPRSVSVKNLTNGLKACALS